MERISRWFCRYRQPGTECCGCARDFHRWALRTVAEVLLIGIRSFPARRGEKSGCLPILPNLDSFGWIQKKHGTKDPKSVQSGLHIRKRKRVHDTGLYIVIQYRRPNDDTSISHANLFIAEHTVLIL